MYWANPRAWPLEVSTSYRQLLEPCYALSVAFRLALGAAHAVMPWTRPCDTACHHDLAGCSSGLVLAVKKHCWQYGAHWPISRTARPSKRQGSSERADLPKTRSQPNFVSSDDPGEPKCMTQHIVALIWATSANIASCATGTLLPEVGREYAFS